MRLEHDVRSTMTSMVSATANQNDARKNVAKKKGGTVPLSSISNDAGVSSSLIRVPSYKNLLSCQKNVSWPQREQDNNNKK